MSYRVSWVLLAACGGPSFGDMTAEISAAAFESRLAIVVKLELPGQEPIPDDIAAWAGIRGQSFSLERHDLEPDGPDRPAHTQFEGELGTGAIANGEVVDVVVLHGGMPATSTVTIPEPFELTAVTGGVLPAPGRPASPLVATWLPIGVAPLRVDLVFRGVGNHTCSGGAHPGAFPDPVPDTGQVSIRNDLIFMQ